MQDQERIRRRAHEIWEREGGPEGRDQEDWAQAIQGTEAEGGGVSPAAPDDASTPSRRVAQDLRPGACGRPAWEPYFVMFEGPPQGRNREAAPDASSGPAPAVEPAIVVLVEPATEAACRP
jgi:hypothetical protein